MFSRVKWKTFGGYSGPQIIGKEKVKLPAVSDLIDRAIYITSHLETGGVYGSITAYDATISGGLFHHVSVYPRTFFLDNRGRHNGQGRLWELVKKIRQVKPEITQRLDEEFADNGWYFDKDGYVINNAQGAVSSLFLRNFLTPPDGKVPKSGEDWDDAKGWAIIFNDIFENPETFKIQRDFEADYLIKEAKKLPVLSPLLDDVIQQSNIYDEMDPALVMFFAFYVNAPLFAKNAFFRTLKRFFSENWSFKSFNEINTGLFCRSLVRNLLEEWKDKKTNPLARYERFKKISKKIYPSKRFEPHGLFPV